MVKKLGKYKRMTMSCQFNRGDVQFYIASWGEILKIIVPACLNFATNKNTYQRNLECLFSNFQLQKFK